MPKISIIEAVEPMQIAAVSQLLRDYRLWMGRRYQDRQDVLDIYFDDEREWLSELADLKGHFGAPHGAIVLGLVDGIPAGCVLLRGISETDSEMKRLFVRPAFANLGLGKRMVSEIMSLSCKRGYANMRFETGPLQSEAEHLYQSMGFAETAPYYPAPYIIRKTGHFYAAKPCAA